MPLMALIGWGNWVALATPIPSPASVPLETASPTEGYGFTNPQIMAAAIIAGLALVGVIVTQVWTYRRFAAEQRHSRIQLLTDRFGKAAEQIGHDAPAVRLAGVYAMASLADEWTEQRQQCVDVLCAYLRLPPRDQDGEHEVRKTVVHTMREHLLAEAPVSWSRLDFNFAGARFPESANFGGAQFLRNVSFHAARFPGHADFRNAVFQCLELDFKGAEIGGTANFNGVHFLCPTWFTDAVFGSTSWFVSATFGGDTDFNGAEFGGSVLMGAARMPWGLDLTTSKFAGAAAGAYFQGPEGSKQKDLPVLPPNWNVSDLAKLESKYTSR